MTCYRAKNAIKCGVDAIVRKCQIRCANNLRSKESHRWMKRGIAPGEYWQIGFLELPKCGQFKYLIVLLDTFSGWSEAFPCCNNKAREVVKILLKEIIPRFGIQIYPLTIDLILLQK